MAGRLLHLGCGSGELLLQAQKSGWEVYGTETTTAIQALEGRREISGVDPEDVLGSRFPENHFSLVIASEALEYAPDPRRFLAAASRKLMPGGLLLIETVNAKASRATGTEGPAVAMDVTALTGLCVDLQLEILEGVSYGMPAQSQGTRLFAPIDWILGLHRQIKALDKKESPRAAPTTGTPMFSRWADQWVALKQKWRVRRGVGERIRLLARRPLEEPRGCPVCGHRIIPSLVSIVTCDGCGLGRQSEEAAKKAQSRFLEEVRRPALRSLKDQSWNLWLEYLERHGWMGRLFDLGCAEGSLLSLAQRRGWDVWGAELDSDVAALAPETIRYRILTDPAWSNNFMASSCEAAVAWDLLDSIEEPTAALAPLYRSLDGRGMLLIRVPNGLYEAGRATWVYKKCRALGLAPALYRRWIFTPKQLKRLLQEAGFEKVRIFSGPPYAEGVEPQKWGWLCRLLSLISFGHLCLGSSLVALARKPRSKDRAAQRRTRVLHLIPVIDESPLAENAILSALSVPYNRFAVEILTGRGSRAHPLMDKLIRQKGLRLRPLEALNLGKGIFSAIQAAMQLVPDLRKGHFDVLHTHGRLAGLIGRIAAMRLSEGKPRLVHSPDGLEGGSFIALALDRWLAKRTDSLVGQTAQEVNDQVGRGVGRFHQWVSLPRTPDSGLEGQGSELRKALNQSKNFVDDFLQYRTEALAPLLEKLYEPNHY